MKYIRTKDGRIIDTNRYLIGSGINKDYLTFYDNLKIRDFELHKDNILEEADTIEELCDGYVIEHPINAFKFFYNKEDMEIYLFNTCMRMFELQELKVYSVIKTSKGLIYAAKMNEKGELELL